MHVMGEEIEEVDEPIVDDDVEEKVKDKIGKELEEIRRRKTRTSKRRFLTNMEDYVLFAGIGYGILFAALLIGMSSGIFGSSTTLDHKASETFLDTGDECLNIEDDPWILIFPENDAEYLDLSGRNLPSGYALMNYSIYELADSADTLIVSEESISQVSGKKSSMQASFDELNVGEYRIVFTVDIYDQGFDMVNATLVEDWNTLTKDIDFHTILVGVFL